MGKKKHHRGQPTAPASDVGPLLRQGRDALEAYDYDAAEQAFTEAVARAGDDPAAAVALLELHVEHLAADADALTVEGTLSSAVRKHPGVRRLLGMAAARSGDAEHARALLRGVEGQGAAGPWLLLCRKALDAGDFATAEGDLEAAQALDPTAPEIPDLLDRVSAARAEGRAPEEARVRALLDAGDLDAAEKAARALLADWPHSAVAGHVLGAVEAARRDAERDAALAEGDAAFAVEDWTKAAAAWRRARRLGADVPRLANAESRRDAEESARRVEGVVLKLRDAVEEGSLEAWVALDARSRAAVAERVGADELRWLEARGAPDHRARARAAVRAGRARGRGRALEDPERALLEIEPYAGVLSDLADARELRARVEETLRERAAVEVRAALAEARAEDDIGAAARLDLSCLPGEERAAAQRWIEVRRRASRLADAVAAFEGARGLLAKREAARAAAEIEQEWAERVRALTREIRFEWRVATAPLAPVAAPDAATIRPDGAVVLGRALAGELFLWTVPGECLVLRPPKWVGLHAVEVEGEGVRCTDAEGRTLSVLDGDLVGYTTPDPDDDPPARPESTVRVVETGKKRPAYTLARPGERGWTLDASRRGEAVRGLAAAGALTFAVVGETLYAGRAGETLWTVPAPSDASLVGDGARAALLSFEAGPQVVVLGETPPALRRATLGISPRVLARVEGCYGPSAKQNGRVSAEARRLERMSAGTIDREMRDLLISNTKPARLVEAYFALRRVGLDDLAEAQIRRASNRFPDDPETRLLGAHGAGAEGRWREVTSLLDEPCADPHHARHHAHLEGLAALFAGAPERALEIWREAAEHPGDCPLDDLAAFVRRAYGPEAPAEPGPLERLVRACDEAERCLWQDDPAGALAALDIPAAWAEGELQSAARRAYAYLALGRDDPEARLALAWLLDLDPEVALNLPPREGAWDSARIAEIRRAARDALGI